MNREEARSVLRLTVSLDDSAVQRAFRRRVVEVHPDRGGDREALQAVLAARRVLLRQPACGRVLVVEHGVTWRRLWRRLNRRGRPRRVL